LQRIARRMHGVKTVSSGATNRVMPQSEFVMRCRAIQEETARTAKTLPAVVDGLWKTEGLCSTLGKYRAPEHTLRDPAIPKESLGIAHVGYGAASTEFANFDPGRLRALFAEKCRPEYADSSIEGVGSILRIYEPGMFKFMCSRMGLIPRNAPPGPDRKNFFAAYLSAWSPEHQWLIAHGYGRLVAFSRMSVYASIDEVAALPAERVEPAATGVGFAYAMMNSHIMPRLLEGSAIQYPEAVRTGFQNGMVCALVFAEWFAPGMLAAWRPTGKLEGKLVDRARAEAAQNVKRGYIRAFRLT
jgi:hypothetical protein